MSRIRPCPMTALSVPLSLTLAGGRHVPPAAVSRASLLAALLRKRAAAHRVGANEMEALLRDQIKWALPIERHADQPSNGSPG